MKQAGVSLAIVSALAGLVGAYYWWLSSRISAETQSEKLGKFEPIDSDLAQNEWIAAMLEASAESARLNKIAAAWTAAASGAAALSAIASTLG